MPRHTPRRSRSLPIAVLALPLAGLPLAAQAPAAPTDRLAAAVREHLEGRRRDRGFPGAGAGVVLPDGSAFAVAVGTEDEAGERPLRTTHRFLSGSIGKTYCAAIALQLVAEGKLQLDGPVQAVLGGNDWYAGVPNAAAVTLRQLLQHQSGIPEHVWKEAFQRRVLAEPDRAPTPVESLSFVAGDAPLFAPGEGWSYADTNYVLVGLMIEEVTGQPFAEVLRQRLLRPLHLDATRPSDERVLPDLCNGTASGIAFHRGPTVTDGRYFVDPAFEYCGGGVCSTPLDLARWGRALFAGDVVPAELRPQQCRGVPCDRRVADGYGLGCFVLQTELGRAYGHSGFMPGFQAMLEHFDDVGVTVALMWNTDDGRKVGNPRRGAEELAQLVVRLLPPAGPARIEAAGKGGDVGRSGG